MLQKNIDKLFTQGKTIILAYDQGLEHGPADFNLTNIDPEYIMDIALEGRFNAVAVQSGIAEKYHRTHYRDVPLIVKLNGKTNLLKRDPVSLQHTSVKHAINLGASAVGYTLYPGSAYEHVLFSEFGKIVEEAHHQGIPVICWTYPRGKDIEDEMSTDVIAYAVRSAMELGADIIKAKYNGDMEGLKWIVKAAGRAKLVIAGGSKQADFDFLKMAEQSMKAGVAGFAVGRNIWQSEDPFKLTKALKEVVFNGRSAEEAYSKFYEN